MLSFCRYPTSHPELEQGKSSLLRKGAYLKTDGHDNIGMPLLGLVRFDTRVDKLHELIEDGLQLQRRWM